MTVVRCPTHNIPYNDENPRGCPACHLEAQGDSAHASLMRQLAQASRTISPGAPGAEEDTETERDARSSWPPPVTAPPRIPTRALRLPEKAWRWITTHHTAVGGAAAAAVTLFLLWVIMRPEFTEGYDPAPPTGQALPVPIEVHTPVEGVFARLGPQAPSLNPDRPGLTRYLYGSAAVDALNDVVYAVTLMGPDRSWKGMRTGVDEETARGMLALQGGARERDSPAPRAPVPMAGYQVYTIPDDRPRRILAAEVRPPNGCYDVQVILVPRIIGQLSQGDGSVVAVARRGRSFAWAVDRVRVVSRALEGPYAGAPACAMAPRVP